MKILVVGLALVSAAYAVQVTPTSKDAVANEEKKILLSDLQDPVGLAETATLQKGPSQPIVQIGASAGADIDPLDAGMEPAAEESAPTPVIVQGPNSPVGAGDSPVSAADGADGKEGTYDAGTDADVAEIEKLPELPFDLDSFPESKNPEDPCRKIRDLTTRWREQGREIAQRTAELVRVRGDERQKVRDQIRRIREDMGKTNNLIRENTRECARTRRPTLRPAESSGSST